MAQVVDLSVEEVALGRFKLETTLPKSLEHGSQLCQVFLLRAGINNDIVKVD